MVGPMAVPPPPPPDRGIGLGARLAVGVLGAVIFGVALWAYDGGLDGAWVDPVAGVVGLAGISVLLSAFRG